MKYIKYCLFIFTINRKRIIDIYLIYLQYNFK